MPADEIEHERQPSKKRAHERNAVTLVDTWLGNAMRDLRTASGLSQRDVANRMTLPPNDTPHPIVANTLQRIDTEGESRTLDSQARKAVQRLEAAVQAPTGSALVAFGRALNIEPATILEAAGVSRQRTTLESAILAEATLDGDGKSLLIGMLQQLRQQLRGR